MSFLKWADVTTVESTPGLFRKVVTGDSLQVVRLEFTRAEEFPAHDHPTNEQIVVILTGRIRVNLGAESKEVGPGEVVVIPPGVRHNVAVLEAPASTLEIFSPPRTDLEPPS